MKNSSLMITLGAVFGGNWPSLLDPKRPKIKRHKPKTDADFERIAAAEAKRERKNALRRGASST